MDANWFLDSIDAEGGRRRRVISKMPFAVGRDKANDLVIESSGLSRRHAVFDVDISGRLRVSDLNSTNGTFVNHQRLDQPCFVSADDVLHFGTAEFRLAQSEEDETTADQRTMVVPKGQALPGRFVLGEKPFMELLTGRGLSAAAQPIVNADGSLFAYELLGRGNHPELQGSPMHLFHLAAQLGREAELSEAFRHFGVMAIAPRLRGAKLFVNTHPKETFTETFFEALCALREQAGQPDLVVEIHETVIVELGRMRELAARLHGIGVSFAYDDWGAGQARINELVDVPAQYVKFDIGLVREIHLASERKQKLVRDLVRMVRDLGSVPLAEGVEFEADATVCIDMGFELLQGYHTGRPVPLDSLR